MDPMGKKGESKLMQIYGKILYQGFLENFRINGLSWFHIMNPVGCHEHHERVFPIFFGSMKIPTNPIAQDSRGKFMWCQQPTFLLGFCCL